MSRMAIPVLPSLAVWLLTFLTYRQREAGARRFLVPLLLEEFERFPDLVVEGCGGHLVLFRPRKILEPAALPRFQDEVRTLARLFPGEMQIP